MIRGVRRSEMGLKLKLVHNMSLRFDCAKIKMCVYMYSLYSHIMVYAARYRIRTFHLFYLKNAHRI
jgi:hypothetical protein